MKPYVAGPALPYNLMSLPEEDLQELHAHCPSLLIGTKIEQALLLVTIINSPPTPQLLGLSLWALGDLVDDEEVKATVAQCGVGASLLRLMDYTHFEVAFPALLCLAKSTIEEPEFIGTLLEAGWLAALERALEYPIMQTFDRAMQCLTNIAIVKEEYAKLIIEKALPTLMWKKLQGRGSEYYMSSIVRFFAVLSYYRRFSSEEIAQMSLNIAHLCFKLDECTQTLSDACLICEILVSHGDVELNGYANRLNLPVYLSKLIRSPQELLAKNAVLALSSFLPGTEHDRVLAGEELQAYMTLAEVQAEQGREAAMLGLSQVAYEQEQFLESLLQGGGVSYFN